MVMSDHFGNPDQEYKAAVEQAALFDFSQRGKVQLTGSEAIPFFQNLCTNDVKNLQPGTGCEAFLTTAKGRVIAPVFISRFQWFGKDSLFLDTAPGLNEILCSHLTRYRISEDVEITDHTREFALFHLCGTAAREILQKASGSAIPDLPQLHHVEHPFKDSVFGIIRRNDLLHLPGFDLIYSAKTAEKLRSQLVQAGDVPAGLQAFEILRIEAGLPQFGKEMDEDRLVMELGRTAQAISFNKGCYLGQETIVMARDRGHVNRSLMGLRMGGKTPVASGSKVFHGKEELGQVTSSVYSPRLGTAIALAFLKRGWQTPGTPVEVESDTEKISAEVSTLPFLVS